MKTYVTSSSFEGRCLALVRDVAKSQQKARMLILDFAGYENVAPYVFNRAEMLAQLKSAGVATEVIDCRLHAPLSAAHRVREALQDSSPGDVTLDISTLPRDYLLVFAKSISMQHPRMRFRYYRPGDYGRELSRGIRSVRAVPGYEGVIHPDADTWLFVVMGFEGYKALHAWEVVSPTRVKAFVGDPPYSADLLPRSLSYNERFLEEAGVRDEDLVPLDTRDALTARDQLVREIAAIREESADAAIVVCPLGTKPQTLGVFAAASQSNGIGVAYVSSLQYFTTAYSTSYDPDYLELSAEELLVPGDSRVVLE